MTASVAVVAMPAMVTPLMAVVMAPLAPAPVVCVMTVTPMSFVMAVVAFAVVAMIPPRIRAALAHAGRRHHNPHARAVCPLRLGRHRAQEEAQGCGAQVIVVGVGGRGGDRRGQDTGGGNGNKLFHGATLLG